MMQGVLCTGGGAVRSHARGGKFIGGKASENARVK